MLKIYICDEDIRWNDDEAFASFTIVVDKKWVVEGNDKRQKKTLSTTTIFAVGVQMTSHSLPLLDPVGRSEVRKILKVDNIFCFFENKPIDFLVESWVG